MQYFNIQIRSVPHPLTYRSEAPITVGSLVKANLRNRQQVGIVVNQAEKPSFSCSEISEVLFPQALSETHLALAKWMSLTYCSHLNRCLGLFLPTVIWEQKRKPKHLDSILKNQDVFHTSKKAKVIKLSSEQTGALHAIWNSPSPIFLLHGITGSGKTEVYLQLIKKNVQAGKQTLLLVPEIALTTELIGYFSEHFLEKTSVMHSRLSDGERLQNWHRIHEGKTKLILGSRSALFTPWHNLGAIILDEEHEWTYKNEQTPRYHARVVAEKIIEMLPDTKLVLGSATPSLESYHAAVTEKRYQLLTLSKRPTKQPLPPVSIVDLRDEYKKKNFSMFSEKLVEAIRQRVQRKEQIILFLNKRGSASSVTCRDCGFFPKCTHCDLGMTYHQKLRGSSSIHENTMTNGLNELHAGLLCHICGRIQPVPARCPQCRSKAFKFLGTGTEKAEDQLKNLIPGIRVLRADRDTTSKKHDFEKIFGQMEEGKSDVLLGTQIITKCLDLPNVTLTGILIADIGLHIPDFRANERVFQLLTQVAGRSGRHKPGEVIIQTYQPDHPAIRYAKNHDFLGFYQHEIKIREQFFYPPFSDMMMLTYANKNAKKAEEEAKKVFSSLSLQNQDHKLQAHISPYYIPRLHGKYLWNILVRSQYPEQILNNRTFSKGWKIDVNS